MAAEEGGASSSSDADAPSTAEAAAPAAAEYRLQLPDGLRPGDRLLLTMPAAAARQHRKRLKALEQQGIEVELFTPPEAAAAPRIAAAEGLGPLQLWQRYCSYQRLSPAAADAGADLLRGLLRAGGAGEGAREQPHTVLEFESVEVEGYFR